jgi:hypothetical protein
MHAIFLTHGHEARYPSNHYPDLQFHYGNTLPAQFYSQLQEARQMASHHSVQASENSREQFDCHNFQIKCTTKSSKPFVNITDKYSCH